MSAPERLLRADRPASVEQAELFGRRPMTVRPPARPAVTARVAEREFRRIRESAEFVELRRRTLRFAVPATAVFMGNFMLFVLLSAYWPSLMATPALGLVNLGTLFGMFQFVSTMIIVGAYCRYARRYTDPLADALRDEVEREVGRR